VHHPHFVTICLFVCWLAANSLSQVSSRVDGGGGHGGSQVEGDCTSGACLPSGESCCLCVEKSTELFVEEV
jgi:hypothetical protein